MDGYWNLSIHKQLSYIRWAFFEENSEERSLGRRQAIFDDERKLVSTVMHENVLRVRGFVVDAIEEVVEHENPLDVAFDRYDQESEEHMALYDVAVDCYLKSLELARYVFYGKSEGVTDNIVYKRAPRTSERRTPPTLRTSPISMYNSTTQRYSISSK